MQARNSLFRTRTIDIVPELASVLLQGRRNRRFKRSATFIEICRVAALRGLRRAGSQTSIEKKTKGDGKKRTKG